MDDQTWVAEREDFRAPHERSDGVARGQRLECQNLTRSTAGSEDRTMHVSTSWSVTFCLFNQLIDETILSDTRLVVQATD
jgi:hypothetical protein